VPRRPNPTPKPPIDETLHCRHFGECGGCSLLDQPIAWQLHDKVDACERLLGQFLGGLKIESPDDGWTPRHFRTRLLYPVRGDRDGLPVVGIYAFRSHDLVRIDECRTQDVWLTEFGKAAEGVLRDLRLPPYHADSGRGFAKAIWARLASGTGQVLAGLVTRPGPFAQSAEFATRLMEAAGKQWQGRKPRKLVGVVHSISERDDEFLLGERHVPLRGTDHVIDRRDGLTFKVSAGSFYQVHAEASELLYKPALKMCGSVKGQRVVDGYGGVGAFGLRLAKAGAASVTIVEDNPAACRDASYNVTANKLANVTVVREAFAAAKLPEGVDLMVVDPPRSGLQAQGVARVLTAKPKRLLHVACAAESLAKDLGELCANGYRVTAMRLCDLFPHTEHVELLTMLERG
jgi:23S rRNA (uracil1939-C5)-methyltransferase